jgi:DNA-binding transcriptional LysR family regulator
MFMDTRFLESFAAVVEHGSMAEAARRLNLTPAAIAQRVRALEAEFGVALLMRIGRTVKPTEAGAAVFARAITFLQELQTLRSAGMGEILSGELRLGAVSTALTGILPAILSRLHVYPRLGVYVAPGTSSDLYRRVVDGDLDAAILVHPPFPIPKVCDWRVLREEALLIIGPGTARNRDPRDLLATEPFIRYDRNHWGGRLADDYLRHAGIRPRERFELDALEAIAVLVDRGLGVSVVPDWAPPWPAGLSVARWQVPGTDFMRRVGLIWTRASPRLRLVDAFLEEAVAICKAPPA